MAEKIKNLKGKIENLKEEIASCRSKKENPNTIEKERERLKKAVQIYEEYIQDHKLQIDEWETEIKQIETENKGSEHRAATQGSQLSSSDHSPALPAGLSLWREPSTNHNMQLINEEPSAGPSTTPADPRKVKQPKDIKEITHSGAIIIPVFIIPIPVLIIPVLIIVFLLFYCKVKHKRRSLTSWWDKIPDANLGNGSNEMMMTIGEHEDNAAQEVVKDFNSVKVSQWLHGKGLSEEDCEKIKVGNISGRAFLRCSKEDWTRLNISLGGTYTLMDLQEEIKDSRTFSDSAGHSILTQGPQQSHPSSVAPPQISEPEPTKYRANTQLPWPSSSDHSTELPEGLIRRPQRSWQDRKPDTHLGYGSNEERETIREHESHTPSPSANPKERYKFKDKRILYGFVVVMIILAGVATGFLYKNATTESVPALYVASQNGQVEVAKSCLEGGAQINWQTNDGTSALHIASQNGHVDVAKLLLEKGAKVDLLNNDQCSPLMIACEHGQTAVVQVLLDHDADTYIKNKKNQTALEIAKENDYVDIISLFAELKEKAAYPGILFSEGVKKEFIMSDEKTINLEDVGISITFPENSLPSTDPPLEITIQPCFSGPFEMPDGIESVSPAYIIKYSRKITFLKDVILKIRHYANLQTKEDCENMVFLSASSTPEYRGSSPVYVFKEITGTKGLFRPRQEKPLGEIQLKHFSIIAIGIKLLNWIVALFFSKLYSARLFRTEKSAIFCMCLYQPEYMQQCEKVIASKYTGIQEPIDCSGVTLSSNEVAIRASENIEWKVFFQKNKILRTEIATQEVYQDNFKELLKLNYPPRIGVTLTPLTPNPEPLKLFVEGLNEECTFNLLPDHYVPECAIPSQDLPHSSVNTQDKEYTPELIESCEDVEKVLKKVNPDYVPYKRMCRYLLKKETCNELIGKNELDVHNIAMYYFQQHPYLYWHDLISILCNQFGENRLASDVAKKHGVSYEKYCPTA